jgi:hypothetical protein
MKHMKFSILAILLTSSVFAHAQSEITLRCDNGIVVTDSRGLFQDAKVNGNLTHIKLAAVDDPGKPATQFLLYYAKANGDTNPPEGYVCDLQSGTW